MLVGALRGLLLGLKDEYDAALEAKLTTKKLMWLRSMNIGVWLYMKFEGDIKFLLLVIRCVVVFFRL